MTIDVSSNTFKQEVLECTQPVIVDFWAPWCAPCKTFSSVFESMENTYTDRIKFVKVNIDEDPDLAGRCGIRSIPSIVLFKNGDRIANERGTQADLTKMVISTGVLTVEGN